MIFVFPQLPSSIFCLPDLGPFSPQDRNSHPPVPVGSAQARRPQSLLVSVPLTGVQKSTPPLESTRTCHLALLVSYHPWRLTLSGQQGWILKELVTNCVGFCKRQKRDHMGNLCFCQEKGGVSKAGAVSTWTCFSVPKSIRVGEGGDSKTTERVWPGLLLDVSSSYHFEIYPFLILLFFLY